MADERQGDFLITLASEDDRPRQGTSLDVLFSLAVWLTCIVSGWATYVGFSVDLPKPVALVLAVAISLFLAGLNFELRKRKRAATGLWGTLAMLCVVVVISFLANTNAIYSYQIRRDIVGQTQEEAWRVFDSETSKILRAISEVPAVAALEDRRRQARRRAPELEDADRRSAKPRLRRARARALRRRHRRYSASTSRRCARRTRRRPPRSSLPTPIGWTPSSKSKRKRNSRTIPPRRSSTCETNIEKVKAFYEGKMREKEYSADTTDLMTRDLDGYAVSARELLPGALELQTINNSADEIGSIQYTWRNFTNWISPTAIVIAVLVSFILDGVVPLFTLLVVRPDNWY